MTSRKVQAWEGGKPLERIWSRKVLEGPEKRRGRKARMLKVQTVERPTESGAKGRDEKGSHRKMVERNPGHAGQMVMKKELSW